MISSNPTIDVRIGEELDPKRLDDVLKRVITGLKGSPHIKQFPSGASNLTYLIGYDNRELVNIGSLVRYKKNTQPSLKRFFTQTMSQCWDLSSI